MHDVTLVHRDLKLENVLICEGNVARLCDFGVTSIHGADIAISPCAGGIGLGTMRYLAPEILLAVGDVPMVRILMIGYTC